MVLINSSLENTSEKMTTFMKLWDQNYKANNDDYQTPTRALDSIYKYIKKYPRIWEPCCGQGNIQKFLQAKGHKVIATDILIGEQYDYNVFCPPPSDFDIIVTNPPFSKKIEFLKRLFVIDKPFAVLLPVRILECKAIKTLFQPKQKHISIFIPWQKIHYERPGQTGKSTCFFHSCWVFYKLRKSPQRLIIESPTTEKKVKIT